MLNFKGKKSISQTKNDSHAGTIATFAAGCFWGVEEEFRSLKGVLKTTVGYVGGSMKNPTYEMVCTSETGHAEAVQIVFDSEIISFDQLLEVFWKCHNPTTKNRQGPDFGSQYRSAVFYHTEEQRKTAESAKQNFIKKGVPIVTEIIQATQFFPAEEYHQKYFLKHGKVCHI